MRRAVPLLFCFASAAFAQERAPLPRDLQPVPEPPPPPPGYELNPQLEPEVTIRQRGEDVVEEFRIGGKLYMMKITPKYGKPYYLVDDKGDGSFVRMDNLDSGTRVPRWVIHQF
ncbi:DUF2782 domain-containing protein [Thiobacter aerophilum]|uniref:DUF2782 domain-containing protein n=1 Tax=Thiobacter aerophilum TaxID=3121275 RepID=A0ABV0EFK3_9BURK